MLRECFLPGMWHPSPQSPQPVLKSGSSLITDIQRLIFSFISFSTEKPATCNTTDRRRKCVFPFKFLGREYNECTWDYAFFDDDRNDRAWCGTREEADWLSGWGDCGEGCHFPGRKHSPLN